MGVSGVGRCPSPRCEFAHPERSSGISTAPLMDAKGRGANRGRGWHGDTVDLACKTSEEELRLRATATLVD